MTLKILPAVADDIADAANWYDEHGHEGLGDRFIQTFYAALPRLLDDRDIYRPFYKDFRKLLLKPFPFFIFYREFEDGLVVALVIRASRRPALMKRLLRDRA